MNATGAATTVGTLTRARETLTGSIGGSANLEEDGDAQSGAVSTSRGTFSTKELGQILSALTPTMEALDESDRGTFLNGIFSELSAKRAAGQDAVLVVTSFSGGGGIISIMSPDELTTALASNDPSSLGSFSEQDGPSHSVRDMMRAELAGRGGRTGLSIRDTMAAAVADMMEEAAKGDDSETKAASPIRKLSDEPVAQSKNIAGNGTVSIVPLPIKGTGESSTSKSPLLLDITT